MRRFGAVGGILVAAILVLAFLELGMCRRDSGSAAPSGGSGMASADAAVLAQKVLARFETSLELDKLSVEVVGSASRSDATLVFDYYTPLGDQSFRLPIVYRDGKWVASETDLATIEKRFER